MVEAAQQVVQAVRALGPQIAARAAETETAREVPRDLVETLREAGVFRMYAPRSHGGLEVPFAEGLEAIAETARADGSTGWAVMIGSATGLLFSRMPRARFDQVYAAGPDLIQAGLAGAPRGKAERTDGGYRVTGGWPFSSGCQHADWIIGLSVITENGEPVPGPVEGGPPSARIVALPAADWSIEDTWTVSGLKGTGSHTTVLKDAFVPEDLTFELSGPSCLEGPLYAGIGPWIPLMHSAFAVGLAQGAIDDLIAMASTGRQQLFARTPMQDTPVFQYELGRLDAEVKAARALMMTTAEAHWARAQAGSFDTPVLMPQSLQAGIWITRACVEAASACYSLGGGGALYEASPLQRRMRDMQAGAQHAVVQQQSYQAVGASLLGRETGHPRILTRR